MKFILEKKGSITKEILIEDIKSVMATLNKTTLSINDYDNYGAYSSSTIIRKFGTWNNVLNLLNIPLNNTFYSDQDFIDNIKDVWLKKGKQPTRRDMDDRTLSHISSNAYLRKYGTWHNALETFVKYITDTEDPSLENEEAHLNTPCQVIHKTKREPSDRLKIQVLMRDGNRCKLCGIKCNDGLHNIHFDHIIPWSKGGETTLDNLQVLCSACNEAKGNYCK